MMNDTDVDVTMHQSHILYLACFGGNLELVNHLLSIPGNFSLLKYFILEYSIFPLLTKSYQLE
jgi:hypothetical protein